MKMIMKAIRIHQYGGPEVLAQVEMQRPAPGANEVLIKVHAASVNPVDWKIRAGYMKDFLPLALPATLGSDVSGTVEEVGPGAARFKRGDEVYASLGLEGGGYAEYAVAKETIIAGKPSTLDHVHAAAVPVAGLTAWQALFEVAQLRAGQKVLIHGAAGGVGNFAVQFAKERGAYVIGTASSRNHAFLHELGADKAVDYQQTRFEEVVRDADVVLDTIGGDTLERSFKALKKGGILVSIVQPPSQEQAAKYGVRALFYGGHPSSSNLVEIARLIDAGKVKTGNCSGRFGGLRQEWAAVESAAEVFEDGQVVFAQCGDVASNASVATSAVEGAKATGDLDSDLHHAESPFGFVVRKGQLQCPQESENCLFVALQTIQ